MTLDQQFHQLQEKLQLLLKDHRRLQKENERLTEELKQARKAHADGEEQVRELQEKMQLLKMTAGEMTEKDKKEFEKKLNQYIRDVEKCIAVLANNMAEELILLNLVLGDRTYRLKVHPNDEEVVRRTAKMINEKLIEYKTQFAGKDMQDYLAMVLIWFATEQNTAVTNTLETEKISDRIRALEKLIDAAQPAE